MREWTKDGRWWVVAGYYDRPLGAEPKKKKCSATELSCEVSWSVSFSDYSQLWIFVFCFLVAVEAANEGRRGFMVGSVFLPSNALYILCTVDNFIWANGQFYIFGRPCWSPQDLYGRYWYGVLSFVPRPILPKGGLYLPLGIFVTVPRRCRIIIHRKKGSIRALEGTVPHSIICVP